MDTFSKFDLHIHSFASSKTKTGDQTIVSESKVENLHVLIDRLISNDVNIVSITDHNIFDKNIYLGLKKQELASNRIFKVLPGIEIDLRIEDKNVHVVCIFDDCELDHARKIEERFVSREYYSVDQLGSMLRAIELSTVLIAHQKCDYASGRPQKTSLSSAGKESFYKFIGSEFFDALEIQNTKVEGILKSRFADDKIENVNLVVGSDCHDWRYYPAHHNGIQPAELLFIKALPTFQGLVMSITDYSRIYSNAMPDKENTLKKINFEVNGIPKEIMLSDKINVIIGDNSVGKSTLIKYLCSEAEKGAIEFLDSHGIKILTEPLNKTQFSFSAQGKIREMFETSEEKLPIKQKFKDYFKPIDNNKYNDIIKNILSYYGRLWERNEKISNNLQSITRNLYVPNFSDKDKHYLSIESNLNKEVNEYSDLIKIFIDIISKFKDFNQNINLLAKEDIAKIIKIRDDLLHIGKTYNDINKKNDIDSELKNSFIYAATLFNETIAKRSSADELSLSTYISEYQKAITNICLDLEYKSTELQSCWDTFADFKMESSINQIGKYCFIDKPTQEVLFNKELIYNYISKYISLDKPIELLTTSEILTSIKSKRVNDKTADNLNQLLGILYNNFINQYFTTTIEIKKGSDRLNESNSAGINALYYIDILSEIYSKPIFIIDQPEDDVSQSRISTDLISSLKYLSKKAQIILVTHNPQLVVNLDADNVIVLKKNELEIEFYSGALEYKNDDYSIIELVANTLDGGADVIRKRWKRYAKSSSL